MHRQEDGMTLVEVLAVLVLVSLVTGIIWSVISIATKFNISETSTLRLQQEANYIIADLQQVHRHCESYQLTISRDEVSVAECKNEAGQYLDTYNKVVSDQFHYRYENSGTSPYVNRTYRPQQENLELPDFAVIDPVKKGGREKAVTVPTTITRYLTEQRQAPK
ncbi:hypothetical protein NCCP2716_29940 [Sporosarcina sp. NCCP-2716]|uniref:prepilin-type N-terminal cleavage/methylation domain-containing protein n=1 Tax=Sporosarcina sp. NCCP-2716 TaxID=2943679 RepID=UPI00204088D2|nr:prepilin-type N-terminal cleavage/methylation domain-containing protein [Sporosarcina sp. NCCP-2716]GKV70496.1 hypothetical protein NCCP2716_29940 [Sporosarcina sp. NCCP-2716]